MSQQHAEHGDGKGDDQRVPEQRAEKSGNEPAGKADGA